MGNTFDSAIEYLTSLWDIRYKLMDKEQVEDAKGGYKVFQKNNVFNIILLLIFIVLSGCVNQGSKNGGSKEVSEDATNNAGETEKPSKDFAVEKAINQQIEHLHGIGYPGNQKSLYIASHHGLKIFKDSVWMETNQNNHDYMGFQPIKEGFVASGHPEKGSKLKNPLGLVLSKDNGNTLDKLAFYGESDFHFLAASYSGNSIFVINEQPNTDLGMGVYHSEDMGKTWNQSQLRDFKTDTLGMIAVHPVNSNEMAMATRSGIYISADSGNTMELITDPIMTTAVALTGDSLYFSSAEKNKIALMKMDSSSKVLSEIKIPFLDFTNPITYLALNQSEPNQISFSTYENDIYESLDGGENWNHILKKGQIE